ncbi:hypothetical protein [Streptomyces sp. NPDC001415]
MVRPGDDLTGAFAEGLPPTASHAIELLAAAPSTSTSADFVGHPEELELAAAKAGWTAARASSGVGGASLARPEALAVDRGQRRPL